MRNRRYDDFATFVEIVIFGLMAISIVLLAGAYMGMGRDDWRLVPLFVVVMVPVSFLVYRVMTRRR